MRRRVVATAVIVVSLIALAAMALVPTRYIIVAPGTAVDLASQIVVERHEPPLAHLYLTDVIVQRATLLGLAARFVPGVEVVPATKLVPRGVSEATYDHILEDAMRESQIDAALVAERAAGYRVADPPTRVTVVGVLPRTPAVGRVEAGDVLRRVDGRPIRDAKWLATTIAAEPATRAVAVDLTRAGHPVRVRVPTALMHGVRRLGIEIDEHVAAAKLPVPVHYSVEGISGSSAGLMFALDVYAALRPDRVPSDLLIAGTGTLSPSGDVGAIEGARQKLIAAEHVGARIFFVPQQNYAEVAGEHGLRVVPVRTFAEALATIDRTRLSESGS